jgi:NAD(P)-dependent dehydrogenase (short-subunit alcohol dehydrogenase family)
MNYNLIGKVVLITGAAGGIGAASARALYEAGANLVLTDMSQDSVDQLAREFNEKRVLALALDVTDFEAIKTVVGRVVEQFGKLDILFSNAGISWRRSASTVFSCDEKEFERIVEVDLLGVFRTIKASLPEIIRNKGQVLVTSSTYAFVNGCLNSPYATSKAGIEMLTRSLRSELAGKGATASVLYPGWTSTAIAEVAFGGDPLVTKINKAAYPSLLRQPVSPEKVAEGAVKGLRKRKPRITVPVRWIPLSIMRGVFSIITDWYLEKNPKFHEMLYQLEQDQTT